MHMVRYTACSIAAQAALHRLRDNHSSARVSLLVSRCDAQVVPVEEPALQTRQRVRLSFSVICQQNVDGTIGIEAVKRRSQRGS